MKSHRIFALATSVVAITLAVMPTSAAALTRKSGDTPVKYMTISPSGSASSADTVIEVVSMLFDYLGHPPW
jgi:hypothetical protein